MYDKYKPQKLIKINRLRLDILSRAATILCFAKEL